MRTTRYLFLTLLMALFGMSAEAQQRNVLQVPDVTTQIGNVQLPVNIENTDEIIGAQFDLTLPAGVTAQPVGNLANRSDGHTVTISQLSSGAYRVLLHSGANRPLRGQSGVVMYLPITIPDTFEEGSEHQLTISNAVLGKSTGENVLTEAMAGKIRISKLPDLTVDNITADKQTLKPGDRLVCSWQVENIGELATGGGWSEQLSLVSTDGTQSKLIATTHYDDILDASGIVSRQAEVTLPFFLGVDGQVKLQVRIVPDSDTGESATAQANNTQTSVSNITINKLLSLELSPKRIDENSTQRIALRVNRSGRWTVAETFTIAATVDSRVSVPTSITIPANQSGAIVYITVSDNSVLDDNDKVTITAKGNNYPDGIGILTIEDNEYPSLMLTASKSELTEGETFQLTVTTSRVSTQPITVTLASENTKRFTFPQTMTIPAGETSATIDVTAINDEIPSLELSNAFTASAPKHNKAEVIVLLKDNDLPVLELQLTPTTVQESAGVVAVAGVLRRMTNTNSKITVKLTDNANGGLYFGNRTLVLDKGVEEVHFNFGPVDNAIVDGDRTYTITAAVWLSSCSCNASGESAGYVEAQLQVLDNDGAALNVTSSLSTVKEGGKTVLTVSRNTTDTSKALTVTINSDYEDGLTYDHTVTIPAGQQSATVEVTSAANSVQGDSHTVIFTVESEGYAKGTCFMMVTDQTLPDARISGINANVTESEVGTKVKLTMEVTNDGAAELPAEVAVKVYRRGDSNAVGTVYTSEAIAVGASTTVVKTITLPNTVGSHSYYAVVNAENNIQELTFNNNTAQDVVIKTTAPFSVTVNTDKAVYQQGEKIIIIGQLTGNNTAETDVDIYLINEGARQVQTVKTDEVGTFTYEWQLYALQSGHFAVGACYPGEGLSTEMTTFDVYGLRRTEYSNITCDVICGDTKNGSLGLKNPGNLNLTGVSVEMLSVPETCEAKLTLPSVIGAGQEVQLSYSLKGLTPTGENKWEEVKARVNTKESVSLDITLYFYCRNAQGKLVASTRSIITTMTKGKAREYSIQVTNAGQGNTGKITLALPECIKSLAGSSLPSINQNDTLTIPLSFVPTEDMQLNVPVTGQFGINCENGEGTSINFSITPVSDETGTLVVDVCDEYTYYTDEAPHVEGAEVVVRNPVTGALVAQGRTGVDGLFTVVLPEGYYKLNVTANNHDSYSNNIVVDPGEETCKVINLTAQAITLDWKVEETEIEDEYEIVTTLKFETNVPEPVVELIVPKSLNVDSLAVGESIIFYAVLTNKGLITAQDAELILPEGFHNITFEPLAQYKELTIVPQQSVFIPVKVTRVAPASSRAHRAGHIDNDPCVGYPGTLYFWDCGTDRKWHRYGVALQLGSCKSDDPSTWNPEPTGPYTGPGWGGVGTPGGGFGGFYWPSSSNNRVSSSEDKGCEPCQNQFLIDLIDCGLQLVPAYRVLKAVIGCAQDAMKAYNVLRNPEAKTAQKAGAVISAVSTCASARHAGSGDKNATREKERAEAIESIIETLGNISGKVMQGGDEAEDAFSWDSNVETIASLASSISTLAGFDFDNLEEMFCPLKLFKPCDKDSVPENPSRRATKISEGGYPSYLHDFRRSLSYGLTDMMALTAMRVEVYGNLHWLDVDGEQLSEFVVDFSALQNEDGIVPEDKWEYLISNAPDGLKREEILLFIERWNNTINDIDSENKFDVDKALEYFHVIEVSEEEVMLAGYNGIDDCVKKEYDKAYKRLQDANSSVCASITLQFKQTMTMTRQAFRGTLTVFNGNETTAMTNVKLTLNVTNRSTGEVATTHEFQINAESLDGFTGALNLGSGWTLAANSTGTATILFIPTKYAAPTEPVEWSFGGTLSYVDPFTGLEVTRELYPVTLTVKPSPDLDLTYFMQRDVYGDDALTLDVVEPMKPAEFALLINNKGNGDATNVKMVTQQPEIIENEKGLYIDFELISSQVNGGEAALSFGQSIANDFGTIPAHSQLYAQWWLTSTLLGHFTDYKVEATHVTSYGNEDLSLLDQVTIHELIHGFDMPTGSLVGGPEIGRAFLVNDIADADDLPDKLYFTNGDTASVAIATTATIKRLSDTQCELTVTPSTNGWNYGSVYDPTHGYAELKSIMRKSDGKELGSTRFWQTDRTLRDGKDWLYENRLHFVDDFATGSEQTYVLTFDPVPEKVLEVVSIGTVPAEGEIAEEPIETLTVDFNKTIDATTFTGDDITFAVQGVKKNANQISISTEDNKRFTLNMSAMNDTLPNGYYTMTVQTADITDAEGYKGKAGKQTSWILFRGGLIVLNTAVWPARAGNINFSFDQPEGARRTESNHDVEEGTAKYGSIITFTAQPEEGHQFLNWTLNGEVVSTDPTYTVTALSDMNVVANFSSLPILIEVEESEGGHIEGLGTGIYEHNTELTLTAVPDEDYILKGWLINGNPADETTETLTLQANEPMKIKAVFEHEYFRQTMTLARGWNWVSSYISEAWPIDYMNTYANRIVGQFDELISDPQYGMVGGLEQLSAGVAYKVEAQERFSTSFRGHLLSTPITMKKGWNWVAYPWTESRLISATITEAEEGDYLVSQRGFTEYADGYWEGSLRTLVPGEGYLYKSASDKILSFDFSSGGSSIRAMAKAVASDVEQSGGVDIHRYPNTMNMTIQVYKDDVKVSTDDFRIHAFAGEELRGISQQIGNNHYLTVYGEEPVNITFVVESILTGEEFAAAEILTFCNDVVGSRKTPFILHLGDMTGIYSLVYDKRPMTIYSVEGILISRDANLATLKKLPKGVYIINGQKCFIK